MPPAKKSSEIPSQKLFLKVEPNENQYKIVLRCPNCGIFFEISIQKGLKAVNANHVCPYCGVDKTSVGVFEVVKVNSDLDKSHNFYP